MAMAPSMKLPYLSETRVLQFLRFFFVFLPFHSALTIKIVNKIDPVLGFFPGILPGMLPGFSRKKNFFFI